MKMTRFIGKSLRLSRVRSKDAYTSGCHPALGVWPGLCCGLRFGLMLQLIRHFSDILGHPISSFRFSSGYIC